MVIVWWSSNAPCSLRSIQVEEGPFERLPSDSESGLHQTQLRLQCSRGEHQRDTNYLFDLPLEP